MYRQRRDMTVVRIGNRQLDSLTEPLSTGAKSAWLSLRHANLLVEVVGMAPGAHEVDLVPSDAKSQEPVRLDMGLPVTTQIPTQRMVTITLGQLFLMQQHGQERFQIIQILASSPLPSRIAF